MCSDFKQGGPVAVVSGVLGLRVWISSECGPNACRGGLLVCVCVCLCVCLCVCVCVCVCSRAECTEGLRGEKGGKGY